MPHAPTPFPALTRLITLIGPQDAPALVAQIVADLAAQQACLRATPTPDAVRRAAHALIALAGTIGATDLMEQARRLHDDPGTTDPGPTDLGPADPGPTALLPALAHTIATLQALAPTQGPADGR